MPGFVSVVPVIELVCSAVDPRASPEPSAGCVTRPDPVERPLNSTRSRSANSASDEHIFIHFRTKAFSDEVRSWTCISESFGCHVAHGVNETDRGNWRQNLTFCAVILTSSWGLRLLQLHHVIVGACEGDWRLQLPAHRLPHNAVFFTPLNIGATLFCFLMLDFDERGEKLQTQPARLQQTQLEEIRLLQGSSITQCNHSGMRQQTETLHPAAQNKTLISIFFSRLTGGYQRH